MSCAYTVPRPVRAWRVRSPEPGRLVLACRCGDPLDMTPGGMVQLPGHHGTIPPIVCLDCAVRATGGAL